MDEELSRRLTELEARLSGRFDAVDKRFAALEQRFDKASEQTDSMRVNLMARMDRLQNEIARVRNMLEVSLGSARFAVQGNTAARDETGRLLEMIDAIQRQIISLDAQIQELRSRDAGPH